MSQPVTIDQLARLYQARNAANKRMGQALRSKDKDAIALAKQQATDLNHATTMPYAPSRSSRKPRANRSGAQP